MMQIPCPWCGLRDEEEFTCGGEAGITRPNSPEEATDQEWAHYLFMRINAKGLQREIWRHTWGCRQWFVLDRHTVTHDIVSVAHNGQPENAE